MAGLRRVSKRQFGIDSVLVAPTGLIDLDVAEMLQVSKDPAHCPLRDPHFLRNVPHSRLRIVCQGHEHVAMIRQEGP